MAQLGDTMIVGDLVVTGKIFPERSENLKDLLDMFYPVGSYYETSDVNFDPAISWGEMDTRY